VTVSPEDFAFIADFAAREAGIVLEPGKEYLVDSRLDAVRRARNVGTVEELIASLRRANDPSLRKAVVDALTTNETSFFRDLVPFELLRKELLPSLVSRRPTGPIRIWCAACSFGQEPFSIAMMLREHFDEGVWRRVELLATDLSSAALARAEAGEFSQLEVNRGLPSALLLRYFKPHGRSYRIDDTIRRMVEFRSFNLVSAWPPLPPIDVVFLRNVLIYFDGETKRRVLGKVRDVLAPEGCLVLGSTETLLDDAVGFERLESGRAVYHRPMR
jgi:chemotaxis protein methyltransferase CheR